MTSKSWDQSLTFQLASWIATVDPRTFSPNAIEWTKHAVLDWMGVTIAGMDDPLVEIIIDEGLSSGQGGDCALVGRTERMTPLYAALINGAASHALDYDDVNKQMGGHPTTAVLAALSAAVDEKTSAEDFMTAFIVGYETSCQIGQIMGRSHYENGWHNTGTIGTFGCAAAIARLLHLDAEKTTIALSLAGTQAAGLKSLFGSMAKPLHSGKAAANGMFAARLAARGFTGRTDILECEQGFAATQSTSFTNAHTLPKPGECLAVENNLFKYYAACFYTHASADAIKAIRADRNFAPADVAKVTTTVAPTHAKVCCIEEPKTALEVKFSLKQVIAMALLDIDLADEKSFLPDVAFSDAATSLRQKVEIIFDPEVSRSAARLRIDFTDGSSEERFVDVGIPAEDAQAQWRNLVAKFTSLTQSRLGGERCAQRVEMIAALDRLEHPALIFDTNRLPDQSSLHILGRAS